VTGELDLAARNAPAVATPVGFVLAGDPPARTAAQLARLLRAAGLGEQALAATAVWLSRYESRSAHTVAAYIRDCGWWAGWCRHHGIDPTAAGPMAADVYATALAAAGLTPATTQRRLSAASSWMTYLIRAKAADHNPFTGVLRPAVDGESRGARGLSRQQVQAMLEVAATRYGHPRTRSRTTALVALAVVTLARSATLRALHVDDLGQDSGFDTIDLLAKGGKKLRVPIPGLAKNAVEEYLRERGRHPGPLLETANGRAMSASQVFRIVSRVAELAGVTGITPHSLRATGITLLLDEGVPIERIAELAGHADVRTTKAYDRKPGRRLARSPALRLAELLGSD
jgi:site-specific recombinase XerD